MYFGEKGEDVRAFGWVFVMPRKGVKPLSDNS